KNQSLFLVIGSPGGPTIINTVLQVILNLVDFNFAIQEAIDAPRVHHQWLPDELIVEHHGFAQDVIDGLRSRGHNVVVDGYLGDAEGILLNPRDHNLNGASDPRGDGLTLGY
ncbi:MAG: gamma-glutamyltransferase, partial [Acidobacteria bacterium]